MQAKEDTLDMFYGTEFQYIAPFRTQLLKWIGNKQRFAHQIASFFPTDIRTYREPFLGSGAVLAALQPPQAVGSDICAPLMEIWRCLHESPSQLTDWYRTRYMTFKKMGIPEGYEVSCELEIPDGLFDREVFLDCGRSMLRRFQKEGATLEDEVVQDRLLLTY